LLGHQDYLLKTGTLPGKSVWMGALPVLYNLVQSCWYFGRLFVPWIFTVLEHIVICVPDCMVSP